MGIFYLIYCVKKHILTSQVDFNINHWSEKKQNNFFTKNYLSELFKVEQQ